MLQLEAVAKRNSFAVPETSDQAAIFLRAIMGVTLYRSDGLGRGEMKGEIVGYSNISGQNYGGSDGPLPPGVRVHVRRS